MFSGIITYTGTVRDIEIISKTGDCRLVIDTIHDTSDVQIGSSIACSGPCLTVVERGSNWFAVDVSKETLKRTTIGDWAGGTSVNLENSLCLGDELSGHLVSGHVDGVGKLLSLQKDGGSTALQIGTSRNLITCIAEKGSICLDGVSLTVNSVSKESFSVNIIPHTLSITTLGCAKLGDDMNIEIDLVARYVARLMEER